MRKLLRASAQHEKEMLRDPAYRTSMIARGRRQFSRTRADAIRVVGMTAEQADRVIDLQVERNLRYADLGGLPGERPSEAVEAKLARAEEAEQAELRSVLGDDKYERWNRYLATSQERAELNDFGRQLANDGRPLRDSQMDTLVETIYSELQRSSREYEDYVRSAGITDRYSVSANDRQHYLDLEHAANQRIHESASTTLSREQLSALDELLEGRLAASETALRLQLQGKSAGRD